MSESQKRLDRALYGVSFEMSDGTRVDPATVRAPEDRTPPFAPPEPSDDCPFHGPSPSTEEA